MATEMSFTVMRHLNSRILPVFLSNFASLQRFTGRKSSAFYQSTNANSETAQEESAVLRLSDSCVKVCKCIIIQCAA